ncbi:PREDICTED: S1 RNA-binding domain-containing protein 1 [Cyphomyrmex costatus]|uniref:S1 RNA-binding domain-containing protein 1 n=1 Tax=Cyphomyrmex costatus TaxID=456900 RepID=A0A151IFV0_9HYME|nr:PREDICTED: S1 RNA-binding domain-containing protein 1 [Cyphomyrmex costatus]KYN00022.1 S1 RNA-binding domain-containing protein 1 [Cyphomyrmex costatus]
MKRNLRSNHNKPIIELDSDDNDCKTFKKSEDEDYIVESNKREKEIISKKQTTKKRVKRNTQIKDVKSVKRKDQEENLETSSNKRLKVEDSYTDSTDAGVFQDIQKNLVRTHVKEDKNSYVKFNEKLNSSFLQCTEWTDVDYISEVNNVDRRIAKNVVKLFKEDNTIPFIARYRKNMTGSMEPDKLRELLESFEQSKIIKLRAATVIKNIDRLGKWSPELHSVITSAKSIADIEDIYSLYKPSASRRLLAEKARGLGLGSISDAILQERDIPPLASLIDEQKEGLRNEQEIRSGIVHIIADVVSKDKDIFDKVTSLRKTSLIDIQTTQCKTPEDSKNINDQKYEQYFNFKSSVNAIKPHHILAINRAESQKIISMKIVIPDAFERAFKKYCLSRYTREGRNSTKMFYLDLLNDGIDHAYKKSIKPQMVRRIRSEMKENAEKASIEVFATNVKQLLLTPPVRGKIVLGIDPGYRHGCKLAVVSEQGDLLETAVIYPHNNSSAFKEAAKTLAKLVHKYRCTVIALGNAKACRETELFLTKAIESNMFGSLNAMYTIVDECGASIYSCSPQAKSEFPDLDPNLVSAISIARRLQDPLAELVKIDPKHLGVGMYQHDLPQMKLTKTLSEVVTEVVSFVGVDINTASHYLLQQVAGLTVSRSKSIIEWRSKNGPFRSRQQLLKVKSIGNKTFEQCAGFIRILPETAMTSETSEESKKSKNDFNPLDQTWIHPESYAIANKFVKYCQCQLDDIGTPAFIEKINFHARTGYGNLAAQFGTDETTMETIVKALTMQKDEDIRSKLNQPLFRNSVRRIEDLVVGTILSGVVRNVTHFGAFVDAGVGREGLIHVSRMKKDLHIGQRVEVKVVGIELARQRISFELKD